MLWERKHFNRKRTWKDLLAPAIWYPDPIWGYNYRVQPMWQQVWVQQLSWNSNERKPQPAVNTANSMEEHVIEKHRIVQIDGNSESFKTLGEIEHLKRYGKIVYTVWCYECDKEYSSRLGFKQHMHNEEKKSFWRHWYRQAWVALGVPTSQ